MAVSSPETSRENPTDRFPLLLERGEHCESNAHIIDIERADESAPSDPSHTGSPRGLITSHLQTGPSGSSQVPVTQSPSPPSTGANFRSTSLSRRGEGFGRRWSPFNTVLWISLELLFTVSQIVAAVVVLYISRNENPQTPLFAWIVGYAAGCALSLPLYYWRYLHRNQTIDQSSTPSRQVSRSGNSAVESNSYITISLTRSSEEEDGQNTSSGTWNGQNTSSPTARLGLLVDHFKMALDCFFAVWFVVGNVWIFGGHSSSSDAPNLYRLCLVFLTFSCIGYAMPFILCAMICCCLPCIIPILGAREDLNGMRGATEESINALPKHKFKLKSNQSRNSTESGPGYEDGGFLAVGTEKERAISGEDAVSLNCA
ncbi:OLC1v1037228C2 [Oldenlandia corymbosa var. corymbosa]|uniref:OLC1v1037228C2 n=1 Tax=Oldenlandia corymbosa var. corymbosa TaxID=529605 RepID=A0AAV1CX28_OLDCO|nr:OLC1v1037228C2 [Oldenlandia corymbosa var. corymbosa]